MCVRSSLRASVPRSQRPPPGYAPPPLVFRRVPLAPQTRPCLLRPLRRILPRLLRRRRRPALLLPFCVSDGVLALLAGLSVRVRFATATVERGIQRFGIRLVKAQLLKIARRELLHIVQQLNPILGEQSEAGLQPQIG